MTVLQIGGVTQERFGDGIMVEVKLVVVFLNSSVGVVPRFVILVEMKGLHRSDRLTMLVIGDK